MVGMKMLTPSRILLEQHYQELAERPFFEGLVNYMSSGPVVAMVWKGPNIIQQSRAMIGATNPAAANPGTIRADFATQVRNNTGFFPLAFLSINKTSQNLQMRF